MSVQWEEPEVIATFDRSYDDKKEELRLERGEYNGRPTFMLRLYWQTPEGQWRWSAPKPNANGKTWQAMSIKARELCELGEALIAAAKAAGIERKEPEPVPRRQLRDTPERKAARKKFDAENPVFQGQLDDDIPF